MTNLQQVMKWEELTASAGLSEECPCQSLAHYREAYDISYSLVSKGEIYLDYISSLCLLNLSTVNLISKLLQQGHTEMAVDILQDSLDLFDALTKEKSNGPVCEDAFKEKELLLKSLS